MAWLGIQHRIGRIKGGVVGYDKMMASNDRDFYFLLIQVLLEFKSSHKVALATANVSLGQHWSV